MPLVREMEPSLCEHPGVAQVPWHMDSWASDGLPVVRRVYLCRDCGATSLRPRDEQGIRVFDARAAQAVGMVDISGMHLRQMVV